MAVPFGHKAPVSKYIADSLLNTTRKRRKGKLAVARAHDYRRRYEGVGTVTSEESDRRTAAMLGDKRATLRAWLDGGDSP